MRARAWIAITEILGAILIWAVPANAQMMTQDVTRNLMGAASASQNGRTDEAKTFVDQAATAARTRADWRAVAESYRALGDTERWSWALTQSTRAGEQQPWPRPDEPQPWRWPR